MELLTELQLFVTNSQAIHWGTINFVHFSYAYIEFVDCESSKKAILLNESLFKGRDLTVIPKRKNVPGMRYGPGGKMFRGGRGGGGGGFRGRGGGRFFGRYRYKPY